MTTPTEILIVWCNCPDQTTATALASGLVKEKLAACVNVLPAVQSIYHWEDRLESANEVPLMIKTSVTAYPKLEGWLQTHHPYTIPEIIALPVTYGLPSYLAWVQAETIETKA
ncbi:MULTISPECIES: divalent-cation tolerance protein CutA [Deefgea]|uniref:Divalent cation tolerance protein CutA n=1 Tax=Deefgea chitinilytica TaxID=570276 RepID=A0ABS2CEJ0_9NEIS|nr:MULTISPECIES: divalent-cation tolerance protein CutA [Deefgea]MBM5572568.1 divalent cation tolerance protein CutA [Deefgea chitinilytica]MBM9889804.1 divalent-cation tolerance protein CutA [Deefgea sp. CFH1-16]